MFRGRKIPEAALTAPENTEAAILQRSILFYIPVSNISNTKPLLLQFAVSAKSWSW